MTVPLVSLFLASEHHSLMLRMRLDTQTGCRCCFSSSCYVRTRSGTHLQCTCSIRCTTWLDATLGYFKKCWFKL